MNYRRLAKDWRVWLLVAVLVFSLVGLAPLGGAEGGVTALSFGLELEGGTLVQISPVGTTVDATGFGADNVTVVENTVGENVDVPVQVYTGSALGAQQSGDTARIEFRGNVSQDEATAAVEEAGYTVEEVTDGVTTDTLNDLRDSILLRLEDRLGTGAGVSVSVQSNLLTGEDFIVVEVPGERSQDGRVVDIIRTQGEFEIRVVTEPENDTQELVTTGENVNRGSVSQPLEDQGRPDSYRVQFELDEEGSEAFRQAMIDSGATQNPEPHPPVMYFNGEEVFRGPLNPSLAQSIDDGTWGGGGLSVTGLNQTEAQIVSVSLRSGALATPVEVVSSTTISARQGEQFKQYSLVIAFLAVLGVGAAIYSRYRDLRIAIPTVLTGVAEVIALLGFSAVFNFNVDLAYVAGLIAVIGTGVDDLIIIADEVQERGGVESADVYRKRLKRAFIIIGMAATTTIGAMLPLAYLGLGRISGFAIVTIVGVLIGVLVTRPAYGSILRELITEKGKDD
jgi:preprotein translocase subunit SecD